MWEVILFYIGLEVPTRQILDPKGAIPSKTAADVKVAIQEMAKYSQKWHNGTSRIRSTKTSDRLAAIQAQLNNLGREIKKVNEKNQGASIKTLEIQIGQMSKVLQERGFGRLCISTKPNLRDHVKSILNTIEADTNPIRRIGSFQYAISTLQNNRIVKYPKGIVENILVGIGKFVFPVDFVILDMPKDVKVPLILERPFLCTVHATIDVLKRKITLRVGDEKIIFKSVKPASSLIKRVYILNLRERMELDLEARLMGETLMLNRSIDHLNRDYIELNNLNEPLELRRDQVDELMPTIKKGEVIDAPMDDLFKSRNDELDTGIDDYPSCCDYDKKIRIDYA
uniref:Putative reverse transcriptase domain-containing protein n=1 Tax=Tanacetum cinerariifolium TaxID=118510 RepID=A0A6L2J3Z9_TANCI|nr:putative reverse transcriptase domain-containing protein [Tanacetum cinerariifolium]